MVNKIKAWMSKPGMFSRVLVVFCLAYSIRIIEWAVCQFENTGSEPETILTVAVGLFGGELLLLCLKRIFAKHDNKDGVPSDDYLNGAD